MQGDFLPIKSTSTGMDSVLLTEHGKAIGGIDVVGVRADDLALHQIFVVSENVGQDEVGSVVGSLGFLVVSEDVDEDQVRGILATLVLLVMGEDVGQDPVGGVVGSLGFLVMGEDVGQDEVRSVVGPLGLVVVSEDVGQDRNGSVIGSLLLLVLGENGDDEIGGVFGALDLVIDREDVRQSKIVGVLRTLDLLILGGHIDDEVGAVFGALLVSILSKHGIDEVGGVPRAPGLVIDREDVRQGQIVGVLAASDEAIFPDKDILDWSGEDAHDGETGNVGGLHPGDGGNFAVNGGLGAWRTWCLEAAGRCE